MESRSKLGLVMGICASFSSFGLAGASPSAAPTAPLPSVERSLDDLHAFHSPEVDAQLALWADTTDPLGPFLEPPPALDCDEGAATFEEVVTEVAQDLHHQRILYRSAALTDCSGMMHRVLRTVAGRCSEVVRPSVRTARRARDLARWYEQQGRLQRVASATDIDHALTVGSVAFFLAPGRRSGGLDRIFHIGVVTEIVRDEAGRIQSYAMFHGRRPGIYASITRWHTRARTPALGNGNERMIAVAWPANAALPPGLRRDEGTVVADGPAPLDTLLQTL